MKKLILHVGPHKTGTTYIQKYLYLNRNVLFEYGWDYPEPIELEPEVGHFGHIKLGIDESQISFYLSNSKSERIIFSSENLYIIEENKMDKLFKTITDAGFEKVIVVFYARHPVKRFYSFIKELIKGGWHYTIPEFLCIYLMAPFKRESLNYTIFLDNIKRFNPEIVIVDYEYFSKISLLTPLVEIMGIPIGSLNLKMEIVNKGIKDEFAEILRYLNLKCKAFGIFPHGYKMFNAVRKVLSSNDKLKEKINELQDVLSQYKKSITVGSFIPSALEHIFINNYSNCFYKRIHESWSKEIEISYITEEWMFNKNLLKIVDNLYKNCVKLLNDASNFTQ
jgi:hypothetical protein